MSWISALCSALMKCISIQLGQTEKSKLHTRKENTALL